MGCQEKDLDPSGADAASIRNVNAVRGGSVKAIMPLPTIMSLSSIPHARGMSPIMLRRLGLIQKIAQTIGRASRVQPRKQVSQ